MVGSGEQRAVSTDDDERLLYRERLERVLTAARPWIGIGQVADYIPALAAGDPQRFGFAVATVQGEIYGIGDWRQRFSIQSISKLFALSLAVSRVGEDLWDRVGREPSGDRFNSSAGIERDRGVPSNPFINAGALVITDELLSLTGDACDAICTFVRTQTGNPRIGYDPEVAASEDQNGHHNAALAHLLAAYGNLNNDVERVLDHYVRQCAIQMSCEELALAANFLARRGRQHDGVALVSPSDAKRINAIMLTCGVYGGAGEFAYRVGLPSKSGVGGGILAVIPNRCTVCAWSPGLDAAGNSLAAVAALEAFTTITGWSVF